MTVDIVLASRNKKKIAEMEALLSAHVPGVHILSLDDIGFVGDIEEDGETYEENALIKARVARMACDGRYATIADDSGLSVDALDGAPGVYSARYAGDHGNDAANNATWPQRPPQNAPRASSVLSRSVCSTDESSSSVARLRV